MRVLFYAAQEFEEKLNELKGKYEAEQMSNAKLQEDMNKLKSQYDQQLAQYTKMSRKIYNGTEITVTN